MEATKKERIVELLEDMDFDDLLSIHREYTRKAGCYDEQIHNIDELDEVIGEQDAYWLLCRAFYGNFEPSADYFRFNGYGNIESLYTQDVLDNIYSDDIADYCIDNDCDFHNQEIRTILDEEDEHDDENEMEDEQQ